jgi:glycerol-3-phosphate dehydrogenase subunit C
VARAVVEVFERNGIEVYYPDQKCCGMPSLLEGDRKLTLEFARFNVDILAQAVKQGYDIVCSCPTCGYMLKNVLKIGAHYAPECREPLESVNGIVSIPIHGFMSSQYNQFFPMHAQLYEAILRDEGYFSSIDPQKRIIVAENSYDVGEYLMDLHKEGQFNTRLGHISVKATYYPPCHLREQKIGRPYEYLMSLIPELYLDVIDGNYCCGNGGIMGFKKEFYHSSIKIASRLLAKIKALNPDVLTTDCLSCRLQFNQLTSYKVLHPIQIIRESYINNAAQDKKKAA